MLRLAGLLLGVVGLSYAGSTVLAPVHDYLRPDGPFAMGRGILLTCLLYALLLAIPFMPGIEIGLALLTMYGAAVVVHVYLSTVLGLCVAYAVGRLVPLPRLARIAARLGLRRTGALLRAIDQTERADRLEHLLASAPAGWVPVLIRHRYLALAVLLNLPGNALIGGGGGIALVVGVSRLYASHWFLVTVALAVLPVPLAVWFFGGQIPGLG